MYQSFKNSVHSKRHIVFHWVLFSHRLNIGVVRVQGMLDNTIFLLLCSGMTVVLPFLFNIVLIYFLTLLIWLEGAHIKIDLVKKERQTIRHFTISFIASY